MSRTDFWLMATAFGLGELFAVLISSAGVSWNASVLYGGLLMIVGSALMVMKSEADERGHPRSRPGYPAGDARSPLELGPCLHRDQDRTTEGV